MEPIARLSSAAAPLCLVLLLLPLPGSLWRAWRDRRLVRKVKSIEALRSMGWEELEILMRRVFELQGYRALRLGGQGADGGVDIVLRGHHHRVFLVQCKQWKTRQVAVNVVRELSGVISVERADGGIIVTCGIFTKEAKEFAKRANITLIDGLQVLELTKGLHSFEDRSPSREEAKAEDTRACPRCGGRLVQRIAKTGRKRGSAFLGCADYPHCRGTIDI